MKDERTDSKKTLSTADKSKVEAICMGNQNVPCGEEVENQGLHGFRDTNRDTRGLHEDDTSSESSSSTSRKAGLCCCCCFFLGCCCCCCCFGLGLTIFGFGAGSSSSEPKRSTWSESSSSAFFLAAAALLAFEENRRRTENQDIALLRKCREFRQWLNNIASGKTDF